MKLIIDIPEEYQRLCPEYYQGDIVLSQILHAVKHGTPIPDNATVCDIEQYAKEHNLFICTTNILEQIRAEIWNAIGVSSGEYNEGYNDGIYHAIDVIDKYTKGESK